MGSEAAPYRSKLMAREVFDFYLEATIATGASTIVKTAGKSRGIASITNTATGVYLLTMDEKWAQLMMISYVMVGATQLALNMNVESDDMASAGTLSLVFQNDAETDTDLDDGTLLIHLTVRNSAE